jgi:hypothetical protein
VHYYNPIKNKNHSTDVTQNIGLLLADYQNKKARIEL